MISNFFWMIFHPFKFVNGILLNLGGGSKILGFIFLLTIFFLLKKIGIFKAISKFLITFKKAIKITYSYILLKRAHLDRNVYGVHNCLYKGEYGIEFQSPQKFNNELVKHPFIIKLIIKKINKVSEIFSSILSQITSFIYDS